MTALVIPAALLVGVTLGALGGGGSILTVPALVYLVGQDPVEATTSSLIIVGTTAVIGSLPHLRAGRVRLAQGAVFGLLGAGGAYLGSRLSTTVPPQVLLLLFAVLMLVVAALMTRRRRAAAHGGGEPRPDDAREHAPVLSLRPSRCDCAAVATLLATASAVGMLTGFFGVGGGFAVVPALVLALRLPMRVAVGTSLVVIAVNSASALVTRLGQQVELDWAVIGVFTAVAVVGSLLGARIAARMDPQRLNAAFTVLLVIVAVYTGVRTVVALL